VKKKKLQPSFIMLFSPEMMLYVFGLQEIATRKKRQKDKNAFEVTKNKKRREMSH
jgi:hypothetical protein